MGLFVYHDSYHKLLIHATLSQSLLCYCRRGYMGVGFLAQGWAMEVSVQRFVFNQNQEKCHSD